MRAVTSGKSKVGVGVIVGVGVMVGVGVIVGVFVVVGVAVDVEVGEEVLVKVGVKDAVGVWLGVSVGVPKREKGALHPAIAMVNITINPTRIRRRSNIFCSDTNLTTPPM
jgi:hypothetical protein